MTTSSRTPRKRVQALAPDERDRAALIAATIPLLEEHGLAVTTRQIADAAGVAEGTIFGVFPDKASLIRAALIEAFRPEPAVRALVELGRTRRDLRERLESIVELLERRHGQRRPADRRHAQTSSPTADAGEIVRDHALASRVAILDAITRRSSPTAAQLRRSPAAVARMLLFMIFAGHAAGFDAGRRHRVDPPKELVSLLLDGLLVRPDPTAPSPRPRRRPVLIRLLRTHLRPYRGAIALVVLLQFVQTIATLYLPTLNADIIDNGVVDRRHRLHHAHRRRACSRSPWSRSPARSRPSTSEPGPRWRSAATSGPRIFSRVQTFSAREVGQFGAPSLITRTTNDVQQVQMLVLLTFTLMVAAPIMCVGGIILALRQDVPLSALLLVIVPVLIGAVGLIIVADAPAVPHHAGAHRHDQPGAARADHRHPGHPGVRPRRARAGALRRRQRRR